MKKIVIAGAGDIGFHLAQMLVMEEKDITMIDQDQEVLDYVATHLDVLTLHGDAGSLDLLREAEVDRADLFLAVTTSEKTNLLTAILAKKMGVRQCIARVKNTEYLADEQRQLFSELGVDSLISPRMLAAREIERLISHCSFTNVFPFEDGKMSLVGLTLDYDSDLIGRKLGEIPDFNKNKSMLMIAILRRHRTIIPNGETRLRANDHIYFISKEQCIPEVEKLMGKENRDIKSVMIIGDTGLAYETARLLEKDYAVTLFANDKKRSKRLAALLDNTLVIQGSGSNIDLLEEEGLSRMDAFIALTDNSEANIISSLTAKRKGVFKTIAQVENREYVHLSQNIGVDTLINRKLIAANNIFRFVRKGQIRAIASLQGVDAEVIEFEIHRSNRVTRHPLRELHFPDGALVGGVIRGDESLIPNGDFTMQLDDKVIVFSKPEAIAQVEKMFR